MIIVPLYFALFAYLLFLVGFVVLFLLNVYHIVSTGTFSFWSLAVTFFTLISITLVLYLTWFLLQDVNWQAPIIEFGANFFNFEK
ncbi:MAG: hypothetical protein L3J07_04215 [Candidatus Magasanikbacteria bacterium]|nr:hypothetical protein [Candidatus Magasanikbacteria bacterium]